MAPITNFKHRLVISGPRSSLTAKSTNCHADGFVFDPMEDTLDAFARGEILIVMDDEGRENEGDLIISAFHCTAEKMAWMIKHTRYILLRSVCSLLHLNNPERLHLHLTSKEAAGGAGSPDDGGPKRGPSPNRLHRHG